LFRNPILVMFCFSIVCFCFGYHVPYTFTTDRAIYMLKIESTDASALVSIMGIANLSSRLVFGWIGANSATLRHAMLGTVIMLCGVLNSLMFLFTTLPLLIVYSVLFGVLSGRSISNISVCFGV
jgi:MCP family monocarboxylic acid transporter-like MFS transporter 13/MCP family monocarboxylic acid transporter-like MFS transporter 12